MVRLAVGFLVLVVIGSIAFFSLRSDPLRVELDRRWPAVNAERHRQAAIDSAASALLALKTANLAVGVDVKTMQTIAFDQVKSKGVTKVVLSSDRQLLHLTADFDRTFAPEDLPTDSDWRNLVAALTPHVVGGVEIFLTVAVDLQQTPQRALHVKLLPALSRVRIDSLVVKGSYDVGSAANAVALILNRYADNISAIVSASPLVDITLPAILQDGFDFTQPIKLDLKEAPDVKLTLSALPVKSPFALGAVAWLIDGDRVTALAELVPLDSSPARPQAAQGSFEGLKTSFEKIMKDSLGIGHLPSGAWAAVGKELISRSLDSAFAQAQPCLEGSGSIPIQTFSAKIPTPDASGIDCTPTRNCTPSRDCTPTRNCDSHEDTRDCSACIVRNPFTGGCTLRGNDPVCEASKAAQNAGYATAKLACETQKESARLDCERLKTQERVTCETEKTGQKLACEAEKGAIDALHRTGNIGNFDGSISGNGSLKLCLRDVHFTGALDKLTLRLESSGSAALSTHFKFTPLDVAGHILCPFEWTADKEINTQIPLQSIGAAVSLTKDTSAANPIYRGRLDELPIKLHFEPSPLSLVLQNINFVLACPVAAGLINGLTLGLAPFIPELLKDYTYKLKPLTFSFVPDLPSRSVFGRKMKPIFSETPLALVVSGTP